MNWRAWLLSLIMMGASLPTSSHYNLGSYGFGTGGTAGTNSSHYSINGIAGDAGGNGTSSHYTVGAGANHQQQADVPLVTLANSALFYNKLLVTITPNGNPTDAKYAVEISPDGFTTTYYVRSDFSITTVYSEALFMDYTTWGGSSGQYVRGLAPATVYTARAAAQRGNFTQSPWGPASTGTTTNSPSLSFEIDIAATDTTSSPPYAVNLGGLFAGSIITAPLRVWVSIDTNADSGGLVYVSDQNAGLMSTNTAHTIASTSSDLSTQTEGYGVQGASATQAGGGPLTLSSPFNVSGTNVGGLATTFQEIFSSGAPVDTGRGSFYLKAKSSLLTPQAPDYADVLTVVAAAAF